jgi:cytochrome c
VQQALDVSAFVHQQVRPADPKTSKVSKLLQDFAGVLGLFDRE